MPFISKKPILVLEENIEQKLIKISLSRKASIQHVERSKILLMYHQRYSISYIAKNLKTNRKKIERCINKALQFGPDAALKDLPRKGAPQEITPEAKAWLVNIACQKPSSMGYSYELWTTRLLSDHAKKFGPQNGHNCLLHLSRGTVSKILTTAKIRPHKITYYCERRDPDFDQKMAQILLVYKQVDLLKSSKSKKKLKVILSYDEKPGVQAIGSTSLDLPPNPEHPNWHRDHEYIRHGTVSIMAGMDLTNGTIHAQITERHRSFEFVQWLKKIDKIYPRKMNITIILDNHSAHISKETRKYLNTKPNRFTFCFTPKHGSWLNMIESFFSKMARTVLRGIRVSSKEELIERLGRYFDELNKDPVIFRWKYKMNELSVI